MLLSGKTQFITITLSAMLVLAAVGRAPSQAVGAGHTPDAKEPRMADRFEGISEARIDFVKGVPRLSINRKPVVPVIFFFNATMPGEKSERYLEEQVRLASRSGVHLYSLALGCYRLGDGTKPNYALNDGLLERFVKVDPQAMFILRIYPGPWPSWAMWKDLPPGEVEEFADGSKGFISLASDYFWGASDRELAAELSHYESGPYGKRIAGYHIGGPEQEMHWHNHRENGPDYSPANQRRFRRWLTGKYKTDEALRKAWLQPEVALATAEVPKVPQGRFPIHSAAAGEMAQCFYSVPGEQSFIDFSEYSNSVPADRIIDWARLVKKLTKGRKLTVFCYSYTFELTVSFSGTYDLGRVLTCPDVDVLMGPYSYWDRFSGGAGNFMSPVDTVTAHGKLWLNEDDTRTHLVDRTAVPKDFPLFDVYTEDMHDTLSVLDRNFGSLLTHRAATWWMDLVAAGAFNHPSLWNMLKERMRLYERVYADPKPYSPEVAVIADERSKMYVKSDWDLGKTMIDLRDQAAKSGAAVGYYTLDDFIGNLVPRCKAYVFANAYRLTGDQVIAVRSRLDREGATAIWVYAPGYLGPEGPSLRQASELVGMRLLTDDGRQGSIGAGQLKGMSWGNELLLSPRLTVSDRGAKILGRYKDGGAASAAMLWTGKHRSVFIGDAGVSSQLLMRLFEVAEAHIWVRDSSVIQTDGAVLMIHTATPGVKQVSLPRGVGARSIDAEIVKRTGSTLYVRFDKGGTQWFSLAPTARRARNAQHKGAL